MSKRYLPLPPVAEEGGEVFIDHVDDRAPQPNDEESTVGMGTGSISGSRGDSGLRRVRVRQAPAGRTSRKAK